MAGSGDLSMADGFGFKTATFGVLQEADNFGWRRTIFMAQTVRYRGL